MRQLRDRGAPRVRRDPGKMVAVREIPITGETIRLGQLLKLAGIADSGGDARAMLEADEVVVNGDLETRRGRQLRPGDVVEALGEVVRVT